MFRKYPYLNDFSFLLQRGLHGVPQLVYQGGGQVAGHRPLQGHGPHRPGRPAGHPPARGRAKSPLLLRRGRADRLESDPDLLGPA
jgi:hypothetical protein